MSKIDELIAKYCPNGVEYKELKDIFKISRGRVMSKEYLSQNKGEYPVYSSQTANNGQIGKISTYDYDGEYLTWTTDGANAGTIFYRNEKFSITNVCGLLKAISFEILPKFAYYVLCISMKSFVSSGMGNPKLMSNIVAKIQIPLPPLPVQQEIVNILDKFTELEEELEKELEEELKARHNQYKYYRNQLLTPVEVDDKWLMNGVEVEWKTLGEVLDYEQPNKYIVKSTIYNDNHKTPVLTAGKSFILGYTNETEGIYKASKDNPVIIFDDFTTSFHWVDFDFKVKSSAMKILHPKKDAKVIFKFVYYEMRCILYSPQDHARQWISQYSKFKIPIPPLSEQERIVEILDKFDSLVNDISIGLPAEIEARHKQYEYYRSKLLSFKPK